MIFKPELAQKVMAGEKTVTRRIVSDNSRSPWWREKCGYAEGQVFAVQPGRGVKRIGHALVTNVSRERLGVLDGDEAAAEGFASWGEFQRAFCEINGEYDPAVQVWRIAFMAISTAEADVIAASLKQERRTGHDSIPTIVRVYDQDERGRYCCCYPDCPEAFYSPMALWWHVHTAHDCTCKEAA